MKWKLITILLVIFVLIESIGYYKLSMKRPADPLVQEHISPGNNCWQQTGPDGWSTANGLVQTRSKCLSVMNSRLGSRFNLDILQAGKYIFSGGLGNQEDAIIDFMLLVNDSTLLPTTTNSLLPQTSTEIGLTYQTLHFENLDTKVKLTITSPFAPSKTENDPNLKLSHAPFFYLTLEYQNLTDISQTPNLKILINSYQNQQINQNTNRVYFNDPIRKDGKLSLDFPATNTQVITWNQHGGIQWIPSISPHQTQIITGIYAGFIPNPVITDSSDPQAYIPHVFRYTEWFKSVDDVIDYAFTYQEEIIQKTNRFESQLKQQLPNPKQYWLAAQAFHSYLGNTWLVQPQNQPNHFRFLVWEGEFKYINTVDVAHEHGVLEGKFIPWAIRSELDQWQKSVQRDDYGPVIPHDIGKRLDIFNRQTYGVSGMFPSAMPVEENANFILLSYWYWFQTQDDAYIKRQLPFLMDLFSSLVARDTNHNGLADIVGTTTYDNPGNLSLLKAPDNVYLSIKQFAAYVSLAHLLHITGSTTQVAQVESEATKILTSLQSYYASHQSLPITLDASFVEPNPNNQPNTSPTIIMGLLYPALTQQDSPLMSSLISLLKQAYPSIRTQSQSTANDQLIGEKLASIQRLDLEWFSHIIAQNFIADKVFNQQYDSFDRIFNTIYDSPYGYTDGHFINPNSPTPQLCLTFYPRGGTLFAGASNQ